MHLRRCCWEEERKKKLKSDFFVSKMSSRCCKYVLIFLCCALRIELSAELINVMNFNKNKICLRLIRIDRQRTVNHSEEKKTSFCVRSIHRRHQLPVNWRENNRIIYYNFMRDLLSHDGLNLLYWLAQRPQKIARYATDDWQPVGINISVVIGCARLAVHGNVSTAHENTRH